MYEHRLVKEKKSPGKSPKKRSLLRQGLALEGRNSPVFEKRFWKGNKKLNQTQFWRYFLIYLKFEKKFVPHAAMHYKPSYRESRRAPRH